MEILISCMNILKYDAIGNDIIELYNLLKRSGYKVYLYTEYCDPLYSDYVLNKKQLINFISNTENIFVFHYNGYWKYGENLIHIAKCHVFFKYHNITPSSFFKNYCSSLSIAIERARKQIKRIVESGKVNLYLPDSKYNADELINYGVNSNKIYVTTPFVKLNDIKNSKINPKIKKEIAAKDVNILFVGRIAPNKGYHHLVAIIREYTIVYGRNIKMRCIGGLDINLKSYYDEMQDLIDKYNLTNNIILLHKVSDNDLYTYYNCSDIFLLMSEHEGFCVPIVEAQNHGLPIIALGKTAVKETIGCEQIIFNNIDYLKIASAIYILNKNIDYQAYLKIKGKENIKRFNKDIIIKKYLEIISNSQKIRN